MVRRLLSILLLSSILSSEIHGLTFTPITMELPQPAFEGLESIKYSVRLWDNQALISKRDLPGSTVNGSGCNVVHLFKGGDWLFSTCPWSDPAATPPLEGSHVMLHKAVDPFGGKAVWTMVDNHPEFLLGREEGITNDWYSGEVIHPEVVRVDNVWYLYSQVIIPRGCPIDRKNPADPQQIAETSADRIMLCVSGDGHTWTRMSEHGVITDLEFPTQTQLINPMVIHVPWNPLGDGKVWWMYIGARIKGGETEYYQIRSDDPRSFSWNNRVSTKLPEFVNQVAYVRDAPGGPLFFCFTCTIGTTEKNGGRLVPSMCVSRDGINWSWGKYGIPVEFPGSLEFVHQNCLEPCLSTVNGSGLLPLSPQHLADYLTIFCVTTTSRKSPGEISDQNVIRFGDILIDLFPTPPKGDISAITSSSTGTLQTPSSTPDPVIEVIKIPLPNLQADARPLQFVKIPSGTCMIGNPGSARGEGDNLTDVPSHAVSLGYDFYLGETEFTCAQWRALMGSLPSGDFIDTASGADHPVHFVSWDDISGANGCLERLNALGLGKFRLPSEVEWEYACRGPASSSNRSAPFSFGDDTAFKDLHLCDFGNLFDRYMWYCGNTNGIIAPARVAAKEPNGYGLYDMHGNLAEWCQDGWHENYIGAPVDGSAWANPDGESFHIIRGGSWFTTPAQCSSASRLYRSGHVRDIDTGFRVVMTRQN